MEPMFKVTGRAYALYHCPTPVYQTPLPTIDHQKGGVELQTNGYLFAGSTNRQSSNSTTWS